MLTVSRKVANLLVGIFEDHVVPWEFPHPAEANLGMPTNIVSRKRYGMPSGMLLQAAAYRRRLFSKWWGTAEDWASLGYAVSRDCQPAYVVSFGSWQPVFNGSQIHPRFCPAEPVKPYRSDHVDVVRCREFLGATKAAITSDPTQLPAGANPSWAWYVAPNPLSSFPHHSSGDWIYLPKYWLPRKPIYFYNLGFHELTHWAEVRTSWCRPMDMRELAAEMGMGLLAALLQVEVMTDRTNFRRYVSQWIDGVKYDLDYFLDCARQAERAAEYLLLRAGHFLEGCHEQRLDVPHIVMSVNTHVMRFRLK